jgi:hypothetical protein
VNAAYLAECEAARDAAQAAQVAAEGAIDGTSGTFTDADLVAGVLTISHALGLAAPYIVSLDITNENNIRVQPDITYGANSVTVDLSAWGTITGTWGYRFGGVSTANLAIASEAEAQAGTNNTKTMTPLRVKDAIDYNALDIASQEEAEAGLINTKIMTPLRVAQSATLIATTLLASAQTVKAWVRFLNNGTISDSFNVSSVVNNSTGVWTISWDTDFADANYVVSSIPVHSENRFNLVTSVAAGSVVIKTYAVSDRSAQDITSMMVVAFGDQ